MIAPPRCPTATLDEQSSGGGRLASGEILVSSLVREIVDARGDIVFGEPRVVELKGIAGTHTVHPVIWD